ncbi:MAG: wcwK [Candidatus Saccharibacteria bacterium]|nr:wcwK [Candidatus Saccharibacteria bacterium]
MSKKAALSVNDNSDIDIDFVILWVDGNDEKWQEDKLKYSGNVASRLAIDDSVSRYRDWGNLKYLFRGIEEFTPWVHRIHFVTEGHVPEWLNLDNPKINHVRHEDFISKKYLPTFSANPIELNMHRIEGLTEHFVYFNDDMFITRPMEKNDFFRNGKPRDQAILTRITSIDPLDILPHILLNDVAVLNKNFDKNNSVKNHLSNWFNPKYGVISMFKNLALMPYGVFSGFVWNHLPSSFLKSTFEEVWEAEPALLDSTSSHKFRNILDVNQYLIKGWQTVSNNFSPTNIGKNWSGYFETFDNPNKLLDAIEEQRYPMICINDDNYDDKLFIQTRDSIIASFDTILPNKSSFEA